jgi:phosphoglucomutase
MTVSPYAGEPAGPAMLIDAPAPLAAYRSDQPDPSVEEERVAFGTSGHRGSALRRSFNEAHVIAILQAICEYRASQGTDGPLFLGASGRPGRRIRMASSFVCSVPRSWRGLATPSTIGGLKVMTENAWFAARPSGTEDVYKIYAESSLGLEHLARVIDEARRLVDETLAGSATTDADSD